MDQVKIGKFIAECRKKINLTQIQLAEKMLIIKKERLERLIAAIDDAKKGEIVMKSFDNSEFEKYKDELQERWGNTDAYKEHAQKTKNYGKDKWNNLVEDMDSIFNEFGLGQMYVADERFKKNIDKHLDGTAAYVKEAITYFCQK